MQTSRKTFVVSELKAFNKGLGKKLLDEKFCKMASTHFAFFRGTNHLYWADFATDDRLSEFSTPKTKTWLQGDLHAYNFGSFLDDRGNLVYGLNDFDESIVSDYQFDVWRMATSMILLSRENGSSKKSHEKEFVTTFADAYVKQLKQLVGSKKEAKINYTAKHTQSPLKDYMKMVDKNNKDARREMLMKWTMDGRFNLESLKLGKVSATEKKAIVNAIQGKGPHRSAYRRSLRGNLAGERTSYFHVLDVAERLLAGTGSFGSKRFYVLLEGKKAGIDDDVILDIKLQGKSSSYPYLSKEDRKFYSFDNDAHRTVEGYRALSVHSDPHLGWVKLPKLAPNAPAGYYAIRERSPEKEVFPGLVADLKKTDAKLSLLKKGNFLKMAEQWGEILATSHARADNDANQARIPYSFEKNVTAVTKGRHKAFGKLVYDVAAKYADQVAEDYKHFTSWFDASKCAGILTARTPSEEKAILKARPAKGAGKKMGSKGGKAAPLGQKVAKTKDVKKSKARRSSSEEKELLVAKPVRLGKPKK